MFEEEFGSIFHCDSLLAGYEDVHLRKLINYQKYTIIAMLGGQNAIHLIHQDGILRPLRSRNRGV
jgi:hypothetical protein